MYSECKITVFTPTYNREYLLGKLHASLRKQSFQDFEWLIVDDGSSDGTEQLVHQWIAESLDVSIRYYKQDNHGKSYAINRGLDLAKGELFFIVDSDDFLTTDALEKIVNWETQLPHEEKYCGVAGNMGTSLEQTPNMLFNEDFFDGTLFDRYGCVTGERAMVFYTEIHRRYKYPIFENEKFMTEAIAYNRMANDGYKMRFYNDIICIYEYQQDGLTMFGRELFLKNPKGYGLWLREKAEFTGFSILEKMKMWFTFYCDCSSFQTSNPITISQMAEYIGAPMVFMYCSKVLHQLLCEVRRVE